MFSWGDGVQRGHLRMEHKLGDGHRGYVCEGIGVQPAHRRLGHELGDGHGGDVHEATAFNQHIADWDTSSVTTIHPWYVSCGDSVVGFVFSFRWGRVY
jgi:hypothetical protein